jgi:hypothetical protein
VSLRPPAPNIPLQVPEEALHPVSSSQLTEARDRVRSFGGYNTIANGYTSPGQPVRL